MTQPTPYAVANNFAADEASAMGGRSTVRTAKLDAELAALQLTIGQILTNLAIIQRDDTGLADGIVSLPSLSSAITALFATTGTTVRGDWVTATAYAVKDLVNVSGATYMCATAHTSGVFATDLAAKKWLIVSPSPSAFAASAVTNTPAGNIAATNVQNALNELDTEKLAKASNLSDLADAVTALANLGALALAGGTMLGTLTLAADPVNPLEAATKQYADAVITGQSPGQCYFAVTSTTQAKLSPRNGNRIFISGSWYTIPAIGVTVSNAGLSTSTTYYVYCLQTSGTLSLELSTTGYTIDSTYGHPTKTGDTSRVLVGMVRTQSGSAIFETAAALCLSYYNRTVKANTGAFSASRSTSSTSPVELNSEIRAAFLVWSGDVAQVDASGAVINSGSGACKTFIGIDGLTLRDNGCYAQNSTYVPINCVERVPSLAEGYHYATLAGYVTANTGTWLGNAPYGTRISVGVMG